jgi:anti-repressor protein
MNIIPFDYSGNQVRVAKIKNDPWWAAVDVCRILSISNPTMAIRALDDDEATKLNLGGQQGEVNFVNEPGLYSLILRSRKTEARKFKRWITHEVIPSIRKTGSYGVTAQLPDFTDPAAAARAWAFEYERAATYAKQIEADRPKVQLADAISASNRSVPIGHFAKVISKAGLYIIGEKNFFKWLRHEKILAADNKPYQRYIDAGWFEVVERPNNSGNGPDVYHQTVITGPGQASVYKQFCNSKSKHIFLNKAAKSNLRHIDRKKSLIS